MLRCGDEDCFFDGNLGGHLNREGWRKFNRNRLIMMILETDFVMEISIKIVVRSVAMRRWRGDEDCFFDGNLGGHLNREGWMKFSRNRLIMMILETDFVMEISIKITVRSVAMRRRCGDEDCFLDGILGGH